MKQNFHFSDMNECDSNPCENGGVCTNGRNAYSCACQGSWNGTNCEKGIKIMLNCIIYLIPHQVFMDSQLMSIISQKKKSFEMLIASH